jgi:hypothetical protein
MARLFISYNRRSEAIVRALADDIEALGHAVWLDQELSGGQVWWNHILEQVRQCDVLVFVLDPEALNSTACKREYGYAADLGKPILPVLASGELSTNLLPPALSQIQFVDYRVQDRVAALRLARALTSVPPPSPLPDPLPPPPAAPISYLGTLTEQVGTASTLSYEQQSALVVDLRKSLRDPETTNDARTLLERLRKRRDLFATIAEEIGELLTTSGQASVGERPRPTPRGEVFEKSSAPTGPEAPAALASRSAVTRRRRLTHGLVGAVLGTTIGVAAMTTYTESWVWGLLTGAGGAVAGAISGPDRRLIAVIVLGAALGWIIVAVLFMGSGSFAAGGVFGAPSGAVLGALIGVILRKKGIWVGRGPVDS